jgi:hypothetical protein
MPERPGLAAPASILLRRLGVQAREQHRAEAELPEISNVHGVELADQVVAFVLDHARMEAFGLAVNGLPQGSTPL